MESAIWVEILMLGAILLAFYIWASAHNPPLLFQRIMILTHPVQGSQYMPLIRDDSEGAPVMCPATIPVAADAVPRDGRRVVIAAYAVQRDGRRVTIPAELLLPPATSDSIGCFRQ
jgi:hypothetical protein